MEYCQKASFIVDKLKTVLDIFDEDESIIAVYNDIEFVDKEGRKVITSFRTAEKEKIRSLSRYKFIRPFL